MDITQIRLNNLRYLIRQSGLTQAEFAEACGSSASTFSQVLSAKGKRGLGPKLARKIESTRGLPDGWIDQVHTDLNDTHGRYEPAATEVPALPPGFSPILPWDSKTPLDDDEVEVPLYMEVELAAGSGTTHVVEWEGPKIRFSKSSMRAAGVQSENVGACFCKGDSMGNVVPDGAAVGVDLSCNQLRDIVDGEIYAIEHGGMLRIKYLYRLPNGGIRIRSELSEEYPDEDLYGDDLREFRIIGFVWWISMVRRRR